jgi:FkbM family methyltransferase
MTKRLIRRLLGRLGYVIRSVGDAGSVTGIDLLHDVQVLLGEKCPLVLFDVGGNVGQTVASFQETFRDPRIFSFEPSPKSFETMRAAYQNDSRVHLENLALGDQEGTLPFQVTKDHSVNDSLLEPVWDAQAKSVPVPVSTLVRYCQQHHIESIDYLKIDTQGYDLKVLQGRRPADQATDSRFLCGTHLCSNVQGSAFLCPVAIFPRAVRLSARRDLRADISPWTTELRQRLVHF